MRVQKRFVLVGLAASVLWVSACASGGEDNSCGDGFCGAGESMLNCAIDCRCGNAFCEPDETTASCAADCYCGNGSCDAGENDMTCALDCPLCGDAVCAGDETEATCPGDCYCGNDSCESWENETTCVEDCGAGVCPDGTCQASESTATCQADCYCGNGSCDDGEATSTCPQDCASTWCGDGNCDPGEDTVTCPEDCQSGCVDVTCDLWPQCGCQTGQKCSIVSGDIRGCVLAGSVPVGGICTADTECAEGSICVGPAAGELRCLQWCVDDNDCAGEGGACIRQLVDSNQDPIPGAEMCTVDCDPSSLSATGCPTGWACHVYYVDDNNDGVPDYNLTDCADDAGTSSTTCDDTVTFCVPGFCCYTAWGDCLQYCKTNAPSCQTGTCTAFGTDPLFIGTTEYGYCQ